MKPFISKNSSTKDGFVFLAVFLILFGILFFCIGMIPAAASYNKEQNWEKIPAVITHSYRRNGSSGTLQVSYEYKGTLYEDVNMKFYSDSMWEGQTITILVNPDRPTQIDNDSGTVLPFYGIFIAVGSVTFLLGLSGCKDTKIKIEGSELNGQKASRKGRAPHPYRNTRLTVLFLILVSIGLVLQDRATLACSVPAQATITNITSKRVKSSKKNTPFIMPMYPIRRTECIMREESGIPIITSGPLEIRLKSVIIPAVPPDALCPMSLQTQYGGMKVFPAACLLCLWLQQYTRHSFFSLFTRTGRGREARSLRAVIRSHKAIRLQRSSRPPPQASRPQSLWPCRLRQALSALQSPVPR